MGDVALIGRLHPLLVHSPIGLVLIAAVAEVVAMATGLWDCRVVAVANVRISRDGRHDQGPSSETDSTATTAN